LKEKFDAREGLAAILNAKNKNLEMEVEKMREGVKGSMKMLSAKKDVQDKEKEQERERKALQQRQREAEEEERRRRMEQQLRQEESDRAEKEARDRDQERLQKSLEEYKAELALAREELASKEEELHKMDRQFRAQERETKSTLRSLETQLEDAKDHSEEEKCKLEREYKKGLHKQQQELSMRLDEVEHEKREAEDKLRIMKQEAEHQERDLDEQFLVASKNEQDRENELYGVGRRQSMGEEDFKRLQDELHRVRIQNFSLISSNNALKTQNADNQNKQADMLEKLFNEVSETKRMAKQNGDRLVRVEQGVDESITLLHQHTALLQEINETVRNNINKIQNMLKSADVPNLIIVIPAPSKKKSSWAFPKVKKMFDTTTWFQEKGFDLHIICPITLKSVVTFDIKKPREFVKKNAGLIKVGLLALKAGNVALKIASKVGTGMDLIPSFELDTSNIDTFIEGMDSLNDEFSEVTDMQEGISEKSVLETAAIKEFLVEPNGSNLDSEMKEMTGRAYENLKEFLTKDNRMTEIRKKMELIEGRDNQKMWVSLDR